MKTKFRVLLLDLGQQLAAKNAVKSKYVRLKEFNISKKALVTRLQASFAADEKILTELHRELIIQNANIGDVRWGLVANIVGV